MKKFMKILAVILAVPVAIFLGICGWCIYDVFLTDNWENYTQTEEYKMKQEQRKIEEEKQAELEKQEQEKKETVKEEPKKEEKKVEEKQELSEKEILNNFRKSGVEVASKNLEATNTDNLSIQDIFDIVKSTEDANKNMFSKVNKDEGRLAYITGLIEGGNTDIEPKEMLNIYKYMIENNLTDVDKYYEKDKKEEEKETVKEEPKKVDNEKEEEIKYAAYRAVSTYNGNKLDLDNVFDIIRNREVGFHHAKPYFGLKVEEGRTMMIKYILEAEDVKEIQGFDEKEIFDMCTVMIENNFIYVEEYFEFIKTPEEKQADKDLVKEMCEQVRPMAIEEAQSYEPVEAWKKEMTADNYKEGGWILDMIEYLVQNYPEATKDQRLEAVEYAKEVFVENFPTIEE